MHQRSHFEYFFKIKVTFSDQSTLVLRLVVALSSKNTNRKRYGARALREIGQDAADAIPALSKLLGDRDARTREYAVEALGNMVLQAPQVLPMLEKAKKDRSKDVAEKARLAIEKIKTDVKKADGSSSESASKEAREAKSNESIKTISQENVSPTTVKSSSETKESNEIIKKLKSYKAGALAYGAFNSFGTTMWELITEAYLLKDKEGKEVEPRVNISESNLSLQLITHSVGTLVFDFSIEGNYAILIGGNAMGETLDSMNAAMLLTVLRTSMHETNPTEEAIAKATKRARHMVGFDVDIQFEYKDIDSGPYNIPLNASFDKVISWCQKNCTIISDPVNKVPVFESIEFVEDGQIRKVNNHGFIDSLHKIELQPSKELAKEQIASITIYFQKTAMNEYVSYAVVFCYSGRSRGKEKLNALEQVLNKKYGNLELIPIRPNDSGLGSEIYVLTGIDLNYAKAAIWKRNILLFGRLGLPYEPSYLLYFTPEAGTSIPKAYQNAVEECRKNYLREKDVSREKMMETF